MLVLKCYLDLYNIINIEKQDYTTLKRKKPAYNATTYVKIFLVYTWKDLILQSSLFGIRFLST